MAVKFAKAFGYKVTVISQSPRKRDHALSAGAHAFLDSSDKEAVKAAQGTMHLIIDTIAADHPLQPLVRLLKTDGMICVVGIPPNAFQIYAFDVMGKRASITCSAYGGIAETQEMLNFCGENQIFADVTLIDAKDVNHALLALSRNQNDSGRFVIKIEETLTPVTPSSSGWEVESDPAIDPSTWHVNPKASVFPESANYHKTMAGKQ
jgi:D-arabinose 1-dehydrogenase-like Zn-dependent alcohol dehydrogenase